ncbi:serine-rich coiled-coil domain-containing protein 2 isoform X3 [Pleurodeles waltl]|uniref:serine-rich coiled-coil domain-containing protein 2 isoform X3 n=1 Tax=Pleurodeles waltl TaxID=8319 RepID=UPI003709991D
MEERTHVRPSLGSRLPKFSGPRSSLQQHMANGSPAGIWGNTNGNNGRGCMKPNGTAPASSAFVSCKKTTIQTTNTQNAAASVNPLCNQMEKGVNNKKYVRLEGGGGGGGKETYRRLLEKTCSGVSKIEHPANMFVSPPEELNQKPSPGLSHSAKFTKGTFLGRTSFSGLHPPKPQVNVFFASRPFDSQRPRANSMTVRSSSKEGLAQATDSMKSLSCERMIRSQSFSHSIQNSMLPTATLTRSHSFNRAVDLTKPYQNQHATIRQFQRTNLLSRTARQSEIPTASEPNLKSNLARTAAPVSGLKKARIPNGSGLVTPLGYQMTRPSLLKPSRSQFGQKMVVNGTINSSVDSCILEKAEPSHSNRGGVTDEQKALMENSHQVTDRTPCDDLEMHDTKVQYFSDDVDEISISSLSSSDKNDLSEDFSDDFLDLEDTNTTVTKVQHETQTPQIATSSTVEKTQRTPTKGVPVSHCKTEEWINRSISAVRDKNESSESTYDIIPISPDMEYREGSSLELSPSDSSDGTYMWDEEGLEPIGSVHPCGSYESSEMNSIDVLNNLDSCDIEDDDLMLDVDLPEDAPSTGVDCENMNHCEKPERNLRQPQQVLWKRSQQQRHQGHEQYRLSSSDHFHHSRELARGKGIVDGFGTANLFQASRTPQTMGFHDNIVMLDEMTLRHMVQDCTAVKTQLLKLKRLLQSEETESLLDLELMSPLTPEPHNAETTLKDEPFEEFNIDLGSQFCKTFSNSSEPVLPDGNKSCFRADDLLNEIRQLKAEAKIKDDRIRQLENQLASKCNCYKEGQQPRGEGRLLCDKFTQTPWRKLSPQVLQPPSSTLSTADQGRLARPPHIEGPSKDGVEPLYEDVSLQVKIGSCSGTIENDPSELSDLLSTQLQIKDYEESKTEGECLQTQRKMHVCEQHASNEILHPQTPTSIGDGNSPPEKTEKVSTLQKSCPKTLHLFKSGEETSVVNHGDSPSEPLQNQSQTNNPLLQTMDMLAETSVKDDVHSDLQLTSATSSQVQSSTSRLLELCVTVSSPSQRHFTVSSPSKPRPANEGLSDPPLTGLSELPLESPSQHNSLIRNPSQMAIPLGSPLLLYSQAGSQSSVLAVSDDLSQSSTSDIEILQAQASTLEEPELSQIGLQASTPLILSTPVSNLSTKTQTGCVKMQKSVSDSPMLKSLGLDLTPPPVTTPRTLKSPTASPTLKSTATNMMMVRSPTPSPTPLKSPTTAHNVLKSPIANSATAKLPTTKSVGKNLSSVSSSLQRLPAASPSSQQSPDTSLLQVKSPTVNATQVQRPASNSSASLSKQSLRNSKLRPPSIFPSKSKQNTNPDKSSPLVVPDHPKSPVKTPVSNIPRPLSQKKEMHVGDSTTVNRLPRLPKPKTQ